MAFVLALVLAGCGPQSARPGEACDLTFYADADGDGYGSAETSVVACTAPEGYAGTSDDCDDSDAAIHPVAAERCDAIDDDCDGAVDEDAEDAVSWYVDADGDAFGSDDGVTVSCVAPVGAISIGGDCADDDGAVHPGAAEICNAIDDDCNGLVDSSDPMLTQGAVWYPDADLDAYGDTAAGRHVCEATGPDGWVIDGTDCDDGDADIHPGAVEYCDRADDDCDGLVDEADPDNIGTAKYYADADVDGYGDPSTESDLCYRPAGWVENADDCDDLDAASAIRTAYYADRDGDGYGKDGGRPDLTCTPASGWVADDTDCDDGTDWINPGAVEICDNYDNDCDRLRDDADPSLVGDVPAYLDADGDGYGDAAVMILVCDGVDGYVASDTDCDDTDDAVHPESIEWCDGIDNDCDGTVDVDVVYVDWYPDADGDGYGDPDAATNDCVRPAGFLSTGDDCDDADASVHPDAVEVCVNDVDENCDDAVDNCTMDPDDADVIVEGITRSQGFGSFALAADTSGDGVADLVVSGMPAVDEEGLVYLLSGPLSGVATADVGITVGPAIPDAGFGDVTSGGDLDGDGFADLAIGETFADAAYVFLGPITADRTTDDVDATFGDTVTYTIDPFVTVLPDVDGDAVPDLVIADQYHDATWGSEGIVYVLSGALSGSTDLESDATYIYEGKDSSDHVGSSVVSFDDDGDGVSDLLIAADYHDGGIGKVWIVDGGDSPGATTIQRSARVELTGESTWPAPWFGTALATGDYDDDGSADIFVGAPYAPWSGVSVSAGAVYCFLGPVTSDTVADGADVIWRAPTHPGNGLAVGDVDGDDRLDVLMATGAYDHGAYLQLGETKGSIDAADLIHLDDDVDRFDMGAPVALVPDWSGDGGDEVLLGVPSYENAAFTEVGAVTLFSSEAFY